jgi:rod shape-determining protein MreD
VRIFIAIALALIGAVVQATVNPQIRVLGGEPDLIFLLVLTWVVRAPLEEGVALAFVGGIALDLLSAVPLGVTSAALLLIIFGIEFVRRQLFGIGILTVLLFTFGGTLFVKLVEWLALVLVGLATPVVDTITYVIFPSMIYNVVLLAPAYFVVRLIQRAFGDEA